MLSSFMAMHCGADSVLLRMCAYETSDTTDRHSAAGHSARRAQGTRVASAGSRPAPVIEVKLNYAPVVSHCYKLA